MTTETEGQVTRFLGLQVVLGLDNEPDGRTATIHYEHNGTDGVASYPDRDNRQLTRHVVASLRQIADALDAKVNDDARWTQG